MTGKMPELRETISPDQNDEGELTQGARQELIDHLTDQLQDADMAASLTKYLNENAKLKETVDYDRDDRAAKIRLTKWIEKKRDANCHGLSEQEPPTKHSPQPL